MHTPPANRVRRRRGGFTLMEVLVAMALSLLLLGGVYSAIHMFWQLSTAGREKMEHAQLARSLFRLMSLDVHSTVFALQEQSTASTGEAVAEDSTLDDSLAYETESYEDPLTSLTEGVYGDSENLILHSSRPSRDFTYYAITDVAMSTDRVGDLAAVNYFLAVRGAGGLSGAVADSTSSGPISDAASRGSIRGLARLESDQISLGFSEDAAQLESLASTARLIAPEVISLSFSYWDGFEWLDSWDSELEGRLPSAIEVTVGLRGSENSGLRSAQGEVSQAIGIDEEPVAYFRHVIALPLADPYPEATSSSL